MTTAWWRGPRLVAPRPNLPPDNPENWKNHFRALNVQILLHFFNHFRWKVARRHPKKLVSQLWVHHRHWTRNRCPKTVAMPATAGYVVFCLMDLDASPHPHVLLADHTSIWFALAESTHGQEPLLQTNQESCPHHHLILTWKESGHQKNIR